jgi:hypothetical protein
MFTMSVSSVTASPPPPPPPPAQKPADAKVDEAKVNQAQVKPQAEASDTRDQAPSKPPLPPGQGTRVDMIA